MKKVVKLEGLCCANCASKIEAEIQKLDGVSKAVVSFMTQRLTLEAEDAGVDRIMEECTRIINKIEPDVEIKVVR